MLLHQITIRIIGYEEINISLNVDIKKYLEPGAVKQKFNVS